MGFHLKRKRGYAAHTRKEYTERLAADRQIDLSNPKCLPLPIAGPNPSVMVLCTLLELTEQSCRFPIGQPADPNFRFCGNQRADDKAPYCEHHMKLTHTTPAQRREQPRGFNYYVPPQI
jgi:hypothetical protein